jgi:yeast amino acid transporter
MMIFYIGGALCVSIVCPFNDVALLGAISAGAPGAAKSPYVIA